MRKIINEDDEEITGRSFHQARIIRKDNVRENESEKEREEQTMRPAFTPSSRVCGAFVKFPRSSELMMLGVLSLSPSLPLSISLSFSFSHYYSFFPLYSFVNFISSFRYNRLSFYFNRFVISMTLIWPV